MKQGRVNNRERAEMNGTKRKQTFNSEDNVRQ